MLYFEDLIEGKPYELGSCTVTKEAVIDFATKYDPQPFHVDEEKAKDSIFGGLAASGWHSASLYMRMLVDGFLSKSASLGSPGLENLKWIKPVFPGDTLEARFTILEKKTSQSRPTMGIIKGHGEVVNQKGELVMTITSIGFFGRNPDSKQS
jgi:acyl dehydratase